MSGFYLAMVVLPLAILALAALLVAADREGRLPGR